MAICKIFNFQTKSTTVFGLAEKYKKNEWLSKVWLRVGNGNFKENSMNLNNIALVTGASSGIGGSNL